MNKLNVGVLFGGNSTEYEVSLVSATSVLRNLDRERFEPIMIGISRDGRWFRYFGDLESIENGKWIDSDKKIPAFISPDSAEHCLYDAENGRLTAHRLDVVFPVLHGKNGEDGTVQGLLALAQIPFVGCDTAASAVCMDKELTHIVLSHYNIPGARWVTFREDDRESFPSLCARVEKELGFPVFVKPARAGSSVGVSKVNMPYELGDALKKAFEVDSKAVVEEFIDGREVECAVMGNRFPNASVLGEIVPCNDFYDYDAKYASESETHIPARLDEKTTALVRKTAVQAYKALGCRGLTRVDFFVKKDGSVILNEPNTLPGFTSISMYPKLRQADGTSYQTVISQLIDLALENQK